jgi:hypothetical protein
LLWLLPIVLLPLQGGGLWWSGGHPAMWEPLLVAMWMCSPDLACLCILQTSSPCHLLLTSEPPSPKHDMGLPLLHKSAHQNADLTLCLASWSQSAQVTSRSVDVCLTLNVQVQCTWDCGGESWADTQGRWYTFQLGLLKIYVEVNFA